jgi:hypothetical protein
VSCSRGDFIYALQYLEYIRQRAIELLVFNMDVNSPQFNDYQLIDEEYLDIINRSYEMKMNKKSILNSLDLLLNLILENSGEIDFDEKTYQRLSIFS